MLFKVIIFLYHTIRLIMLTIIVLILIQNSQLSEGYFIYRVNLFVNDGRFYLSIREEFSSWKIFIAEICYSFDENDI